MKKILLSSIIYFFPCMFSIQAQTLYGAAGTIGKFIPGINNLTVVKSFESFAYGPLHTNFIQANDGKLYGMTFGGGSSDAGVIFSYDPMNGSYKMLKDFDNASGSFPHGSLMQASNGKLYGMTAQGGIHNYGVIFSFDPSTSTYTKLIDFDGTNGWGPTGSLMQASDGKLYGVTESGGSLGSGGVIFSFDPVSSTYTKLKDFEIVMDGENVSSPQGTLAQASDGKLYGMTNQGGSGSVGVIFSFDPSTSTYTKLKDFDNTNGANPNGSLIRASDGMLYGMTPYGGSNNLGVIFSFNPSSSVYTNLKDLDQVNGAYPYGSLVQANDSKLYGMTNQGGSGGVGVIFSFGPSTSTYTKLIDFDGTNGADPQGSLMQANNGKLYGMTGGGGNNGRGIIFSFDPSAASYVVLKDFSANENGSNVIGALVQAIDGKLYGMTAQGGSSSVGVIFSFDPSTSTYTKLKDFDIIIGNTPRGSLIQATNGKMYGMTVSGGNNGSGVIFSFDPSSSTYTKLKDFDNINGANPYGSLMQANNGKLYGMTVSGGSSNFGVIFSFDPSTSIYTKLIDFDGTNGAMPYGNLMQASDGKLYGMTNRGGSNYAGVIFSFDPSSSTYTMLKDFNDIQGARPDGSLIQANDGKLYGMSSNSKARNDGRAEGYGVIFSFDPSTLTYTKLIDFDDFGLTNGGDPEGNLMQASDGKLYGMTFYGGSHSLGVIFSFDPTSSTFTKLVDYDGLNGGNPSLGSAFIEVKECISKTFYKDADNDGYGNPDSSLKACTRPEGYVTNNTDCNDNNAAIHTPVIYYRDADGDGYGDANNSISVCETTPPAGYVTNNYDCDDHDKLKKEENERVVMCHNGKSECVIAKEIQKRLEKGWTLGPCTPALTTMDAAENVEMFSKEQSIPRQYKLSNYPNPFKGTSTIKYELPFDSKVSIKVYDLMGRVLATLVNADKKAGTYTIDFNAGNLSKGSLYYRITATSKDHQFEQTNKMIQIQ